MSDALQRGGGGENVGQCQFCFRLAGQELSFWRGDI